LHTFCTGRKISYYTRETSRVKLRSLDSQRRDPYNTADHEKTSASDFALEAQARPRFFAAYEHAGRAKNPEPPSTKRPLATDSRLSGARLPARERLHLTKQFHAIRRRGTWARGRLLAVGAVSNDSHATRLGLRVRRGLKGSVARNRAKRQLRAAYRQCKARLAAGRDLLVVIRQLEGLSVAKLQEELLNAAARLGILLKQ